MTTWKHLAAAAILVPGAALADPAPAYTPWSGDASLGYLRSTGSVDSTALNAKGDLIWKVAPWENDFNAYGAYTSSAGVSSAENWGLSDKLSHDLTPRDYVWINGAYRNDRFNGVVSAYTEAVGYGRHIVKTDRQTLDGDIGLGASQQRQSGFDNYGDQLIVLGNLAYTLKITDTSTFSQTLHVEAGRENTFINPITTLKFVIVGNLFCTLAYNWQHNTEAPAGTDRTDTTTTINIGYTFGKKPS
jgi:putative salt-induced outer membrane protein